MTNKDTLKERDWLTDLVNGVLFVFRNVDENEVYETIDAMLISANRKLANLIEQTRKEERERIVDIVEKEFETQEIDGIKTGRLSVGKEWFREIINNIKE